MPDLENEPIKIDIMNRYVTQISYYCFGLCLGAFFFLMGCKVESGKSLFNEEDLAGWDLDVPLLDSVPNAQAPFVIKEGMLVSLGEPRGHLMTRETYRNYRLEVEYRFPKAPGNCGVLVHASETRALYDMFPKSIEVQLQHGNAGDFWCIVENIEVDNMVARRGPKELWGITEGKKRRIENVTDTSEHPLGEWNTMTIECLEDVIKVWVNGDLVNHGWNATVNKGKIAIQAEGAVMEFRKMVLTPISELSQ